MVKKSVGISVLEELKRKSLEVPEYKNLEKQYILFSKSGFTQELIEVAKEGKVLLSDFK